MTTDATEKVGQATSCACRLLVWHSHQCTALRCFHGRPKLAVLLVQSSQRDLSDRWFAKLFLLLRCANFSFQHDNSVPSCTFPSGFPGLRWIWNFLDTSLFCHVDRVDTAHGLLQKPQPSVAKANGTDKSRIAVLGASGYTGEEVIRLMALHPSFAATVLTGESQAGKVGASCHDC